MFRFTAAFLASVSVANIAMAQATPADLAAEQATQIQRDQAQGAPSTQAAAPTGAKPNAPVAQSGAAGSTCLQVNTIDVRGAKRIGGRAMDRVLAPFSNRCLGLVEINGVLEAVTFAYVNKGFITARAFLPEQDLSDGSLDVVVVEGELEAIAINGDAQGANGHRVSAFPGMIGKPVNLRRVEQGLDQMSRLQSVDANMQIAAGSEQGTSVLMVNRKAGSP